MVSGTRGAVFSMCVALSAAAASSLSPEAGVETVGTTPINQGFAAALDEFRPRVGDPPAAQPAWGRRGLFSGSSSPPPPSYSSSSSKCTLKFGDTYQYIDVPEGQLIDYTLQNMYNSYLSTGETFGDEVSMQVYMNQVCYALFRAHQHGGMCGKRFSGFQRNNECGHGACMGKVSLSVNCHGQSEAYVLFKMCSLPCINKGSHARFENTGRRALVGFSPIGGSTSTSYSSSGSCCYVPPELAAFFNCCASYGCCPNRSRRDRRRLQNAIAINVERRAIGSSWLNCIKNCHTTTGCNPHTSCHM